MNNDYLEEWHKVVADGRERMCKQALERLNQGEPIDKVNIWLRDQERLLPPLPPPPGLEYLNDPTTVCPEQYLDRIAETVYPSERYREAIKRIRERIRYWKKKNKVCIAPHPPFPEKHVFTDSFFRWLVKTYPALREVSWIHPHYKRVPISASFTSSFGDATPLSASIESSWINLDAWSEIYVGAKFLVEKILPEKIYQMLPEHGALSQMVIVASHQLVEVMLFSCIEDILKANPGKFSKIEKEFRKTSFKTAFTQWAKLLTGSEIDCNKEPFLSSEKLRERRNGTIHKTSKLASVDMARSALFSAVEASKAIYSHFNPGQDFKYKIILEKYPLPQAQLFSVVRLL